MLTRPLPQLQEPILLKVLVFENFGGFNVLAQSALTLSYTGFFGLAGHGGGGGGGWNPPHLYNFSSI